MNASFRVREKQFFLRPSDESHLYRYSTYRAQRSALRNVPVHWRSYRCRGKASGSRPYRPARSHTRALYPRPEASPTTHSGEDGPRDGNRQGNAVLSLMRPERRRESPRGREPGESRHPRARGRQTKRRPGARLGRANVPHPAFIAGWGTFLKKS